ncbi:MAG: hypothetical protein ACKOPS_21170 [Cyanobium sp.]
MAEIPCKNLSKGGGIWILCIEQWVVQLPHTLTEAEHLFPLLSRLLNLSQISWHLQFICLAKKPFDLWKATAQMTLHRPVEFFFRSRFRLASGRAKPLTHDAYHQRQRAPVAFQGLLGDQILRTTNTCSGVVLPVNNDKLNIPLLRRGAIVLLNKFPNDLSFLRYIARRGKKDMVLIDGLGRQNHARWLRLS